MRGTEAWKRMLENKTDHERAKLILSDLIGYRTTSPHRPEDADNLTCALAALAEIASAKKQEG